MPYDSFKARKAIQTANAYERLPGSEFVMEMAKILKEADEEFAGVNDKIRNATAETRRYQIESDDLRLEIKRLKESSGRPFELLVATMKEIAGGAKSAKAKAAAALLAIKPEAPATAESMLQRSGEPIVGDRIGDIQE